MFGCVTSVVVFVEVFKNKRLWLVDKEGVLRIKKHKKEAVFFALFFVLLSLCLKWKSYERVYVKISLEKGVFNRKTCKTLEFSVKNTMYWGVKHKGLGVKTRCIACKTLSFCVLIACLLLYNIVCFRNAKPICFACIAPFFTLFLPLFSFKKYVKA